MKLVTFTHNQTTRIGAVVNDWIVDGYGNKNIPTSMLEFLSLGAPALLMLQELINSGNDRIELNQVKLHAPVPKPEKYLGISLNYADHIAETGREQPAYPSFFTKQSSCIIGDGDTIYQPKVSNKLDYEGELAFIIGKRCRHVPVDKAHQVIAGFTIANDISIRDWQMHSPTMMIGKSFDTAGPLGPWLVTPDEIKDPHNLTIKTWVNDE